MVSKLIAIVVVLSFVSADHGEDALLAEVELSVENNVAGDDVATVDDSSATGSGEIGYTEDSHEMSWELEWSDLSSDVTSIEFRGPAAEGETSDEVIHTILGTPTSPLEGDVTLSDENGATLESDMVYIVFITEDYPGGEMRAQITDFTEQEDGAGATVAPLLIVAVFVSVATLLVV